MFSRRVAQALGTALSVLLVTSPPASAATFTNTVRLIILEPSTAAELEALRFGSIGSPIAAGIVTIDPSSGARSQTGGVELLSGDFGPGHFAAQGTPNRKMNIKVPKVIVTLTHTNGIDTMIASNFTRTGKNGAVKLDGSGLYEFFVGADLAVGAGQTPGVYSGTYEVDINFQ